MNPPLLLTPSTHLCEFPHAFILLDSASGKYFRIAGVQSDWFREILGSGAACQISQKAADFALHLIRLGLVTYDISGKPPPATSRRCQLRARPTAPLQSVHVTDIIKIGGAHLTAARMMKRSALTDILDTAADRKRQAAMRKGCRRACIFGCASIFERVSPLFHSSRDACFVRSLALLLFLAREGHSADWVFGVRDEPFRAHCWIEADGMVLNDEADHAAEYDAILSI